MTNTRILCAALGIVMASGTTAAQADARAKLAGFQEVPSVFTDATGSFRATLDCYSYGLSYKLSIAGVESSSRFMHIHFGQRHTNGGVIVFLCNDVEDPRAPSGTPSCPSEYGTVEGVVRPQDLLGPVVR